MKKNWDIKGEHKYIPKSKSTCCETLLVWFEAFLSKQFLIHSLPYSVDGMAAREARMAVKRMFKDRAGKWIRPYYSQQMVKLFWVEKPHRPRSKRFLLRGSKQRERTCMFLGSGTTLYCKQPWEERYVSALRK